MRLADFGLRTYSLNLVVNEMAYLTQARQQIARQIEDAVQEGYQFVRDKPAEAAAIFGKLFPNFRRATSSSPCRSWRASSPRRSAARPGSAGRTRSRSCPAQRLLNRAVSAEEVAIYD